MNTSLIFNDDKPGNWIVSVIAEHNHVNGFQCRSRESAITMAHRIRDDRASRGLPTHHFTLRQLTGFNFTGRGRRKRRERITTPAETVQF